MDEPLEKREKLANNKKKLFANLEQSPQTQTNELLVFFVVVVVVITQHLPLNFIDSD